MNLKFIPYLSHFIFLCFPLEIFAFLFFCFSFVFAKNILCREVCYTLLEKYFVLVTLAQEKKLNLEENLTLCKWLFLKCYICYIMIVFELLEWINLRNVCTDPYCVRVCSILSSTGIIYFNMAVIWTLFSII